MSRNQVTFQTLSAKQAAIPLIAAAMAASDMPRLNAALTRVGRWLHHQRG